MLPADLHSTRVNECLPAEDFGVYILHGNGRSFQNNPTFWAVYTSIEKVIKTLCTKVQKIRFWVNFQSRKTHNYEDILELINKTFEKVYEETKSLFPKLYNCDKYLNVIIKAISSTKLH